jgi:hypothetical protein
VREEPGALALVDHTLKSLRWGANPGSGCVSIGVRIPGPTWRALWTLVGRVASPGAAGEEQR